MPEAAIHEDGDFGCPENEIRLAKHGLPSSPAGETVRAKNCYQRQFRVPVAVRPDFGHYLGAFGFGENVRHGLVARGGRPAQSTKNPGQGQGKPRTASFD
jgi:hypothetical protein